MYRRSYQSTPVKAAPPEYKGHTFSQEQPKMRESDSALLPKRPEGCRGLSHFSEKKEHSPSFPGALFSHGINMEDLLLLGLIFLLIKEGADELLIIALGYLFIAGL